MAGGWFQLGASAQGRQGFFSHGDPLEVDRFSPSARCWKSASLAIGTRYGSLSASVPEKSTAGRTVRANGCRPGRSNSHCNMPRRDEVAI